MFIKARKTPHGQVHDRANPGLLSLASGLLEILAGCSIAPRKELFIRSSNNTSHHNQVLVDKMMESKEVYDAPVTEVQNDTQVGTVNPVGETLNRYGEEYVGKYRRSFVSRHIQIVTLGSNIGSGLFISTGKALRNAGPGNMIIGYTAVMTMVR